MSTNALRFKSLTKPGFVRIAAACCRCGGSGVYAHYGICFRCGGEGQEPNGQRVYGYPVDWTEAQVEAHQAKLAQKREASAERKAAKERAIWDTNLETFPVLAEADALRHASVEAGEAFDGFVLDILFKAVKFPVTERQAAAVGKALERMAEREAQAAQEEAEARPVPTGRIVVEGEVLTTKWQDSSFGGTLKMLVKGEGWKVWGSVPSGLRGLEKGDKVRFTATVEASEDDPSFGFFKRPTKAEVLEEVAA
jgi:hypothetical protein